MKWKTSFPTKEVGNAILLHDVYIQSAQFWRPAEELNRLVPLGFLIMLGILALSGFLFIRFGGAGIRKGLEFGFLIGLTGFIGTLGFTTMVPWPTSLVCAMAPDFYQQPAHGTFFRMAVPSK